MIRRFKIVRTATIPSSLDTFCNGLFKDLERNGEYEIVAISSPGVSLDLIAEREGVKVVAVPMVRQISPFKDLVSLWRLVKVFRKERPDMVHSMTPKAGLLSMLAAWFCRVPVRLHTFTGLVFPTSSGLKKKILIFTDRLTCACATHVVPEGDGVKRDLIDFGITSKTLKVLGHGNIRGIDLNYYDRTPEVLKVAERICKKGVFTFIFVGRIVGDKGINELIVAFKRLNIEYPDTRLLLIGRFEPRLDPLKSETIEEIEKNKSIEAVGEQEDVRPWLAASDAFVFPSYREGFPNVVIEAGAMRLPSIVTDINGSREIVQDGNTGTIIPVKDDESLYAAMKFFVEHPQDIKTMGKEARPLVASRYEQSYVRQCLKDYYRLILSQNI